ncbi:MAG: DUF3108 domain-containing protein [Candidatus Neomarinimicrobiota bacterium]
MYSIFHLSYGNTPFKVGEILEYNASFAGINAAKAQLKVLEKKEIGDIMTFHVQFTAKSLGLTNYIFPINDKIDIWLDENSLFTIKEKSNIEEGKYSYSSETIFNHKIGHAYTDSDTIIIKKGTHPPYSLFYYLRKLNLDQINKTILNTIQKKKITTLKVFIENNIETVVPAGRFLCTKISPKYLDKKKIKNEAQMSILFSNDKKRYPVKIWLKLKYGTLMLELNNIIN